MSKQKRAWWKFWQKKPKDPDTGASAPLEEHPHQAGRSQASSRPPPRVPRQAQSAFEDDPDGTVDLHVDDLGGGGIDGDTLNLPQPTATAELPVPERASHKQTSPSPALSDEEHAAKVQAARERAARHRGRFGTGIPSSDMLPAASQELLQQPGETNESPEPEAAPVAPTDPGTEHPAPGALFAGCLSLLTVSMSLPLWLTSWPPMRDLPGHLGLLSAFQTLQSKSATLELFSFSPKFYVGSGGDYLLALAGAVFPLPSLVPLLLQIYILASLFAMLYLLLSAECSLWSACLGLMLLFNGAFFEGNLGFLMATPVLLFGLGFLLQWMAHKKTWAAVASTTIAWLLLLLDPTAYTLFLSAAFCTAFLYANTMSRLLIRMLLPASSLLLFLPWLLVVSSADAAAFGASASASTLSWSPYSDRLFGLIAHVGWPLHSGANDAGAITMAGLILLVGSGVVLYLVSKRDHQSKHLRAFFPTLTLLWLALYLLFPVKWRGTPITGSAMLSMAALSFIGWSHIDLRRTAGKLLLTATILWGFVTASLLTVACLQHEQRTKPLMELLKQVPPKGKLLLWKLPGKAPASLRQAGGFYMTMAPGNQSNIDLRGHLRWKIVAYRKPYQVPPATSPTRPKLQNWDYLLTGWHPPPKQRPFFRLLRKYGKYRLYRVQVP